MNQNELLTRRVIIELYNNVVFAGKLLDIMVINNEESYIVQTDDNVGVWASCKNTKRIELVPIKE